MDTFRQLFFIVLLSSLANTGFADAPLPGGNTTGQIDVIDLQTREVIINDWVYKLALDLKIHSSNGAETDFALKQGLIVKYELDPSSIGRNIQTITDIWLEQK